MTFVPDDEEYQEFLSKVDDVSAQIDALKSGDFDAAQFDAAQEKKDKAEAARAEARARKKAAAKAEAEEAARKRAEAAERQERLREENRDQLEKLKQDYYLRKARRERWEAFRAEQKSRTKSGAFTDYYRGWEMFEDDPDEDLFSGDTPAAVEDQSAFDAMAKDIEERSAKRLAGQRACEKERERGNGAFKAGQYSEALAAYTCAVEHCRTDKAVYSNRALCHLKLRNFLSAVDDASRAIELSQFHDDDWARAPTDSK